MREGREKKESLLVIALCITVALGGLAGCKGKEAEAAGAEKAERQEMAAFTEEDLKGLVTGIEDRYILEGAKDIDWSYGVEYDKDVVVSVKEDSSKADLSKTGTYTVTYTVTVDVEKMTGYLEEAGKSEDKDMEQEEAAEEEDQEASDAEEETPEPADTADIAVEKEMTVVDKAKAEELAGKGEEVWTDKNEAFGKAEEEQKEQEEPGSADVEEGKKDVQQGSNPSTPSGSAQASKPQQTSTPEPAPAPQPAPEPAPAPEPVPEPTPEPAQPVHQHSWVAETTTTQVWVEDSAAWDEPVYADKVVCGCGAIFDGFDSWNQHSIDGCMWGYSVKPVQTGTTHHDATGHYESQTASTGRNICSGCGAVQ